MEIHRILCQTLAFGSLFFVGGCQTETAYDRPVGFSGPASLQLVPANYYSRNLKARPYTKIKMEEVRKVQQGNQGNQVRNVVNEDDVLDYELEELQIRIKDIQNKLRGKISVSE